MADSLQDRIASLEAQVKTIKADHLAVLELLDAQDRRLRDAERRLLRLA